MKETIQLGVTEWRRWIWIQIIIIECKRWVEKKKNACSSTKVESLNLYLSANWSWRAVKSLYRITSLEIFITDRKRLSRQEWPVSSLVLLIGTESDKMSCNSCELLCFYEALIEWNIKVRPGAWEIVQGFKLFPGTQLSLVWFFIPCIQLVSPVYSQ